MKNEMMNNPRLLICTTVASTIQAFILPYLSHFHKKNWFLEIVTSDSSELKDTRYIDKTYSISWSRSLNGYKGISKAFYKMREIILKDKPDLIHTHTPIASFIVRLTMIMIKNRPVVIYTAHGFHFHSRGKPLKNAVFVVLERLAGFWTDYLVVMNDEDLRAARRLRIVPPERIQFMPGIGIDTELYAPSAVSGEEAGRLRRELGADKPLFLMIAEFIPRKRHADALRAFAELVRTHPATLAFAGTGPELTRARALAAELQLSEHVRFLGFRRDVPELLRAADALLLVSDQEGLPRSVMEALSMEVPVIGTNIRGVSDLLKDGTGMLVEVGDRAGLARAMAYLIEHPEERRAMGRRGRERMRTQYELKHILALHEDLYERALANKRGRGSGR